MSIDKYINKISYIEEDSPFFGKDYGSLMSSQKRIHLLYVQGKAFHSSSKETFRVQEETHSRIKKYKRTYAERKYCSHINASKLILNS